MRKSIKNDRRYGLTSRNTLYGVLYTAAELQESSIILLAEGLAPPLAMVKPFLKEALPEVGFCSVEKSKTYSPASAEAICPSSRHSKKRIFFISSVLSIKCLYAS